MNSTIRLSTDGQTKVVDQQEFNLNVEAADPRSLRIVSQGRYYNKV